jgi:hypothetical protein
MFAFDSVIIGIPLMEKIILAVALATILVEFGLVIAVITGRNDSSKLRHRLVLLFGVSLFIFLVGECCSAIYEYKERTGLMSALTIINGPVDYLDYVNHIERDTRGTEVIFRTISTFGVGASLMFWLLMHRRLGLDQSSNPSNTPSTI